ncbi:tetratricopeptide repeat protein [Desulfobulbus sp.]|uniref:tetratricopeptide repeat protein n=1 Tax=Desulfobulbus sp. TaxID=895 RepID=UPI0027BA0C61|nr:tetratricopeptide repeat protein [Desulfobulbus sp.]
MIFLNVCPLMRQGAFAFVCAFCLCIAVANASASQLAESGETPVADFSGAPPLPSAAETWQEQKENMFYEILKKQEPTAATQKLEKILSLVQQGTYKEAQQQLEEFIRSHPGYGPAHEILGLVLLLADKQDQAVTALQKAVELDPKSSSALTKLGGIYMAQGQKDKAKQILLKAVAVNPHDRFANQRLGMLCEEAGEVDKAIAFYEQGLLGTLPDYIGVKVNLAGLYNKQRQFAKTIPLLAAVIKPETKNATGHILLGTAYLYSDQAEKAIRHYQYAAAIDKEKSAVPLAVAYRAVGKIDESKQVLLDANASNPKDALVLFQLAETYSRAADFQAALQGYHKAIEAGYPKTPALRQIAALQMRQAKYNEAIETLRQIIASEDSVLEDQFVMGEAYQFNRQFTDAEKLFRSLSERHPKDASVWYRLGLHYGLTRDYVKAIGSLQKAKTITPQNPAILKALALAYFQGGKKSESLAMAEELHRLQPENKESAFFLASLYQSSGKIEEAKKGYLEILATPPAHASSLNNLADLTAQSGEKDKALSFAKQAVELEPDNSRYLDTLGWILFQVADYEASLATLEKAYKISPKVPIIQFHLGKVYLQKGEKEKAKQLLQSSVSEPSASWAAEANSLLHSID